MRTNELLTQTAAAAALGISQRTMQRWAAEGRGPRVHYVLGRPGYQQADIDEYLRGGRHV